MTVAETYLVLFAAISAADFLLLVWLLSSVALNLFVFFCSDRINRVVNTCLLVLYSLFSVFIVSRWLVIGFKVLGFLELLEEAGEVLPPRSASAVFGLSGLVFIVVFIALTLLHLRSNRSRVRVI